MKHALRHPARATAVALSLFVTLALAACGDQEAEQRKAFVTFLQTRIIDKPGLHVPQLTPDERKSFGPYADQYAIITGFHQVMNESVSPKLAQAMARGNIASLADLVARRADLQVARETIDAMALALTQDVVQADEAHRKLDQRPDVKAVFDTAYERLVTTTAATFREIVPVADRVFNEAVGLATFVDQRKDRIKITDASVQVSDPASRDEFNARLQRLQASQQAAQAAQTKLQTLVYGGGG